MIRLCVDLKNIYTPIKKPIAPAITIAIITNKFIPSFNFSISVIYKTT